MTLTVDASVWIASAYPQEPDFLSASTFIMELLQNTEPIVSPNLLLVELAAAAARKSRDTAEGLALARSIETFPGHTITPLNHQLAAAARQLAADHFLRGADAVYLATASLAGSILITLDRELLTRTLGAVLVMAPSDWLRRGVNEPGI